MKVAHLVAGSLDGGAARGALWLHQGLLALGVKSHLVVDTNLQEPSTGVCSTELNWTSKFSRNVRGHLDAFPLKLYPRKNGYPFSSGLVGYPIHRHPIVGEANIINLHWVNNGFVNLKHARRLKKPLVWTLRDMWPLTGGCHYALSCDRYRETCGSCPQLGANTQSDLSSFVLKRKLDAMRGVDITCVGISNWMTSRALESAMFRRTPVVTINNAINCDVFYPVDKNAARKIFSLDLSKKIITIGAQNITDHYKGSLQLFEALRLLSRRGDLHVLAFGKAATTQLKQCGVGFTELGVLRDNLSLRLAYSAGDVFVCASLQEAFGKTVAEAMACGTPAIAFDSTGPADIIVHKTNGYLAEPYSSQSLADGVNWALGAPSGKKINELARAHIINTFSPEVIAKEYVELYESLLRKRGAKISA